MYLMCAPCPPYARDPSLIGLWTGDRGVSRFIFADSPVQSGCGRKGLYPRGNMPRDDKVVREGCPRRSNQQYHAWSGHRTKMACHRDSVYLLQQPRQSHLFNIHSLVPSQSRARCAVIHASTALLAPRTWRTCCPPALPPGVCPKGPRGCA